MARLRLRKLKREILAFDFFYCKVIKNIFHELGACLLLTKDTKISLCFVLLISVLLRVETVIFSRAKFPANLKVNQYNILESLSTSSSLKLKLMGSSCKECRVIKSIAQNIWS